MSLLERIMNARNKHKEKEVESTEAQVKERILSLVYDEDLAKELTPVFMKLQSAEGFNKVLELLETKERQIEAISGGEWFNKTTDEETTIKKDEQDAEQQDVDYVDAILKEKYKGE